MLFILYILADTFVVCLRRAARFREVVIEALLSTWWKVSGDSHRRKGGDNEGGELHTEQ